MTRLAILVATLAIVSCQPVAPTPPNATPAEAPPKPAEPGAWDRAKPTRAGNDWPQFLGPTSDNVSSEKGIITAWPRNGLKILWQAPLGTGYATPALADGKLLHFDAFDTTARVTCRNAETGEEIWKFDYAFNYEDQYGYDNGPRCCPVVHDGRVYIHGVEGMLHALDFRSGDKLWTYDTRAKHRFQQNFFGVGSTPVVEGDLLLVAVGGSPKGPRPADFLETKPDGSGIVALDRKSGEAKYAALDELASYASPVVATIHGKRVGLYFARGGLVAFEPKTGRQYFRYPWRAKLLESVNASNPLVVGDTILLTECYGPGGVCLKVKPDLSGVTEVWSDKEKDREDRSLACHWNTPIHHDGFVYGSSGRHENEGDIRCVSLANGEVAWREKRATRCSLLKVDGHLLSLGERGDLRLFKLDARKFDEVARMETDLLAPCWAPPVLSRGLLYIRGKDRLLCLELIPRK
jgi:outer membrane protein assembly factor BamB